MNRELINRITGIILTCLSLTALLAVISGYFQAPQPDEGAAAHIFQLSVATFVPALLVFLVTADWKKASRTATLLAVPMAALVAAFMALYHLEH